MRAFLRETRWPAALAAAFGSSGLVAALRTSFGWDEIVYLSQVSDRVPTIFFGAHRARGIPYLLAPLAQLTTSATAFRIFLAVASAIALWVTIEVWKPIHPLAVRMVAGGIFVSLWVTRYNAPRALPNLWVALAGSIALATFLRAARGGPRWLNLSILIGALAAAALFRPADAVWIAVPLAVAALARRDVRAVIAIGAGIGAGLAQWVVESYRRFDGPLERLREATELVGGGGFHPGSVRRLQALNGPALCLPCDYDWHLPLVSLWLSLFVALVALGVRVGWRANRRLEAVLPLACGALVAMPYLATVDFGAPRFLIPSFALLSWPAAEGLLSVWRATRGRQLVIVIASAMVITIVIAQSIVLAHINTRSRQETRRYEASADLLRAERIKAPCLVTGEFAIPVSFRLGCRSEQTSGSYRSITPAGLARLASRLPTVVLDWNNSGHPTFADDWEQVRLPVDAGFSGEGVLIAYLSPHR